MQPFTPHSWERHPPLQFWELEGAEGLWEPELSHAASEEEDAQKRLKGLGYPCMLGTMELL